MSQKSARRSSYCVTFEPPIEHWPDAGVYQLWLRVSVDLGLTIGRLGRFAFPAGRYVYTGRACRGLPARVLRHVNGARKKHWHIDYLLAGPKVRIERAVLASDCPDGECVINQALAANSACVAPGFGASDCRARCGTHLWRVPAWVPQRR